MLVPGSIHVNFFKFDPAFGHNKYRDLALPTVIIHEALHRFWATKDLGYVRETRYVGLSKSQRLRNADRHAFAAISLHARTLSRQSFFDVY